MSQETNEIYEFGPFRVNASERVLRRGGNLIPITPKCFDTLLALLRGGDTVAEKAELLRELWPDQFVEESNLSQQIFTLRKALGTTQAGERYIQTIPKRGYRFTVPVVAVPAAPLLPQPVELKRSDSTGGASVRAASLRRSLSYLAAAGAVIVSTLIAARLPVIRRDGQTGLRITRLFVPNNMVAATISPDGSHFAYASHDEDGQSLWVRETAGVSAGIRLRAPAQWHFWGIGYSPAGDYIYYVFEQESDPANGVLFRVPALGGESRALMSDVSTVPAFSPGGQRLALKRYDPAGRGYLLTAAPDGTDRKVIAQSDADFPFYNYEWSTDGRSRYYTEKTDDSKRAVWSVWEIAAAGGTPKLLMRPQPKPLRGAQWLNESEILVLIPDEGSRISQLWRVDLRGEFLRMTSGLTDFSSITLTADRRTALATCAETRDTIWTADAGGQPVRMSLPEGAYNYPVWTHDRRVLFAGDFTLWLARPDGSDRKAVVAENVIPGEISVSPDGRFAVFVSERGNSRTLWRVDLDGRNLRQVTAGPFDWHPTISPDSKWLVYESRVPSPRKLWKAPLDGGSSPVRLTDNAGGDSMAISPDGGSVAYRDDVGAIEIRSLEDGKRLAKFNTPSDPSDLNWSADGSAMTYLCHAGRAAQLWRQPFAGGPPMAVNVALPLDTLHVAWSSDRRSMVWVQREIKMELALVTGFR